MVFIKYYTNAVMILYMQTNADVNSYAQVLLSWILQQSKSRTFCCSCHFQGQVSHYGMPWQVQIPVDVACLAASREAAVFEFSYNTANSPVRALNFVFIKGLIYE